MFWFVGRDNAARAASSSTAESILSSPSPDFSLNSLCKIIFTDTTILLTTKGYFIMMFSWHAKLFYVYSLILYATGYLELLCHGTFYTK